MPEPTLHDEIWARYQEVHEGHLNYDPVLHRSWAKKSMFKNIAPHFRNPMIPKHDVDLLEIACGQGHMLEALGAYGHYKREGTDLCPINVIKCQAHGLKVQLRDVFKNPLDQRFDAILMMGIIEHIKKDELLPSMRNVMRMLRPGGSLVITTQNMDAVIGTHYRYLDMTHELGFTRESLNQIGRLCTDGLVEVYPWRDPVPDGLVRKTAWVLRRLYRPLWKAHVFLSEPERFHSWFAELGLIGVWWKK